LFVGILMAALGWSACRSSPPPDQLFAEAEGLRARYVKEASQQAIGKYRQAIAIWERQGKKQDAARAWQRVGATYEQIGSLDESFHAYRAALSLVDGSSNRLFESQIRSDVGIAQTLAADSAALKEARQQCDRALEIARQANGTREVGKGLKCLAEVAYFDQDFGRALDFYRQAGQVFETLGEDEGLALAQLQQGHVYSDLRKLDDAQACLDRAQALWARVGDKRQQAIVKVAKGRLAVRRGNYQEALNQFQEALISLEPMGDAVWEGASLTGMGWVYEDMGETGPAIKHWERAVQLYDTAGLKIFAVEQRYHLGGTYLASGDHTSALRQFERVLALAGELGIERWRAWALRYIGVVHLVRHQPDQALHYLDQAAEAQRRVGDSRLARELRADFGVMHDLMNEHEVAAKYFGEALALSQPVSDHVTEARALFGLATASLGSNKLDDARRYIERAVSVAESLRTGVESRDLRASYVASVYGYYELQIDVLARLSKVRPHEEGLAATAFEASEGARARSLVESLTESGVDLRAGVNPELLRREQAAKLAFDDWANRNRGLSDDPKRKDEAQRLASEYRDLEERYSQIQAEIRSRSPQYAALARPQALSLKEIQKEVLDRDTVLLEYALGEERSYVWAVSDKDHTLHGLPGRAEIEGAAQRVYDRLVARLSTNRNDKAGEAKITQADEEYWQEAGRLSDMLIAPIAKNISGKRLLVVTDGMLQYVPFSALPIPGRATGPVPMLVEHEIVNLPSASVLAVLRREATKRVQPSKAVAVFADPVFESDDPRLRALTRPGTSARPDAVVAKADTRSASSQTLRAVSVLRDGRWTVPRLAATRLEADAIVASVPAGMALKKTDFDASRATALGPELGQYRIVHFATHGVFDNENPGLSGLILSLYDERGQAQDGFLRLHDIYNLKLPADLVVLSACNTALGKQVKGEGLMGMVRGFLYAGAERVVASLWKVDDEATGELMGRFYAEMLKQNRSPAAALREAQLAMWRQDRWRAPFYWAAFVVQGEPR
jgi:CHAT domain-containing protein/Tfp pilus assembly protein PilF